MTDNIQNGEGVEVIQSDRDAAAALVPLCFGASELWQSNVRAGYYDDGEIVQAFAKHRHSLAREPATADVERVARIIDPLTWRDRDSYVQIMAAQGGCQQATIDDIAYQKVRHSLRTAHDVLAAIFTPTDPTSTRLTITINSDSSTSFHSSIPPGQSWEATHTAMATGLREFQRQFDESDRCPVKALSLAAPSSEPAIAEGERLRLFLEILSACGGEADASDSKWNWINAFCEDHEGRSPDTFNTAIDRGFATSWYDGDRDHGTVNITDAGRAFLAQSSTPPASKGVEVQAGWKLVPEAMTEEMIAAWANAPIGDDADDLVDWCAPAYAAMLAASPTPSNDTLQGRGAVGADRAWFDTQRRLSLSFYSPMYGDDDDQSEEWRVTQESGPINDREWDVVGRGQTVDEAISDARAAIQKDTRHGG